jgi:homoserine kinase type II
MAVYTQLNLEETTDWFKNQFDLGEVVSLKGISSGIENSNFFLSALKNQLQTEYVLTIFERLSASELSYYLELMQHLSEHGVTVPAPFANKNQHLVLSLKDKPAALVSKLEGASVTEPSPDHCHEVGIMLAKMHLAGLSFDKHQPNLRSLPWWEETIPQILPFVNTAQQSLLSSELKVQTEFFASSTYQDLPQGPSHCDLFRDNVLFKNSKDAAKPELSGFFDFYFAGTDKWLFDICVTVNDWCIHHATGTFKPDLISAFLHAYQEVRPFTDEEEAAWPFMQRAAALRFWISRLWDFHLPREASLLTPHDPTHFERILRLRIKQHAN